MTPVLLSDMGGWAAIRAQLPDDQFYLYPRDADMTTWFNYARAWLVIGLGNLAGQDLLQRQPVQPKRSRRPTQRVSLWYYLSDRRSLARFFGHCSHPYIFPNLADPEQVMMKLAETYLPHSAWLFLSVL